MALVRSLLAPRASAGGHGPLSDFWYAPAGASFTSLAGLRVDSETAMKLSAVWACVRLLSNGVATLPLPIYERKPDGSKLRAYDHPLHELFARRPNDRQTIGQFLRLMQTWLLLRGEAHALIVPGPRGFVDQLIPLDPNRLRREQTTEGVRYRFRLSAGTEDVYAEEDVLRLMGLSLDGENGMGVLSYARESMGLGLAADQYAARFFSQDARPRGVLKTEQKLNKDSFDRLKEDWKATYAGLGNAHNVAILEQGLEFQPISVNAKDSQLLESREFQVEDVARWFGVPLHLIQSTSKTTSWGTGIEQQDIGFVVYSLMPWLRIWEEAVSSLILAPDKYFAEFKLDMHLRADIKTRYEAYSIGRQNGFLSIRDVHRFENLNTPDVEGVDDYHVQVNMVPVDALRQHALAPTTNPTPAAVRDTEARALAEWGVRSVAGKVARREAVALAKAARRCGSDAAAWGEAVDAFYADHAAHVRDELHLPAGVVAEYAALCAQMHAERGPDFARIEAEWPATAAEMLADLKLTDAGLARGTK